MNSLFPILAQAGAAATSADTASSFEPVEIIWRHINSLGLIEALTFVSFGVVCLFYGWRIFKILAVICFGLAGMFVGIWVDQRLVRAQEPIWLPTIFTLLSGFFAVPFLRWGVSVLGAGAGGVLTAGAWLGMGLPHAYLWAGALIGLIAGGLLSFIVFKSAVMLFTSLGGSGLMMMGVLAILQRYSGSGQLETLAHQQRWFLPVMFLVPMVIGIIMQNRFIKGSQDWSV